MHPALRRSSSSDHGLRPRCPRCYSSSSRLTHASGAGTPDPAPRHSRWLANFCNTTLAEWPRTDDLSQPSSGTDVMQLRILTAADIRACLDMRGAIDAMRTAFTQLSSGDAVVPDRVTVSTEKAVSLFMPGYLPEGLFKSVAECRSGRGRGRSYPGCRRADGSRGHSGNLTMSGVVGVPPHQIVLAPRRSAA